jgi:hypothetical protein
MNRTQERVASNLKRLGEVERVKRREQSLDDALQATFPASDPPAALAPHGSSK